MRARRWWAWPLVPAYAAGLAIKDALRSLGLLRTRTLAWPVVSVGSLSAGGAGKTPVVIALAELLRVLGWHVDVLSRGYGRDRSNDRAKAGGGAKPFAAQVEPDVSDAAARYGDEPTLIARKTGLPVWVGADRYLAGKTAEDFAAEATWDIVSESGVKIRAGDPLRGVHLLDDGFQHRQLARAVDVVLVTDEDFEDALLPAGNRREPLAALRRANVVVLREEEHETLVPRVRRLIGAEASIWVARRKLHRMTSGRQSGMLAFCAIARPEGFWSMLRAAEFEVVKTVAFEDHHAYTLSDVDRLVEVARANNAREFITTEKDAVKLTAAMRTRLETVGPVCVAELELTFLDEASVVLDLERRLG